MDNVYGGKCSSFAAYLGSLAAITEAYYDKEIDMESMKKAVWIEVGGHFKNGQDAIEEYRGIVGRIKDGSNFGNGDDDIPAGLADELRPYYKGLMIHYKMLWDVEGSYNPPPVIKMIKKIREVTGLGLKVAKGYFDDYFAPESDKGFEHVRHLAERFGGF